MEFEFDDDLKLFQSETHAWVDRECPKAWARELEKDEHNWPFALFDKFTKAGFHGIGIDESYGGQGGNVIVQMILARELARSLGGLAWLWGLTSFAGAKSIGLYGSEEQKQRFLPSIARGELRFAIGFTEPGGGTDVLGGMRSFATKVDGGWQIDGNKTWCSAAHTADYILLLARTDRDVAKRHQGLSLFLLPTSTDGVTISDIAKLGMRALGSCDVGIQEAFVPDELLLGTPGEAWRMLLPTLNNERIILASFCCGILDGVLEDALAFV